MRNLNLLSDVPYRLGTGTYSKPLTVYCIRLNWGKNSYYVPYSVFDDNFAGDDGSALSLYYYSGRFDNVTFSNHKGTAVRVSTAH